MNSTPPRADWMAFWVKGGGVAHVLAHQVCPGDLHQLAALQHADGLQVPGNDAGHGGFARAGIAGKDHVHGGGIGLSGRAPGAAAGF